MHRRNRTWENGYSLRRRLSIVLALVIVLALSTGLSDQVANAQEAQPPPRIAIVKSFDLPEYNLAHDGFMAAIADQGHEIKELPFLLTRDEAATEATCQAISEAKPDLIFALGTRAAREMAHRETTTPIVYAMVLAMTDDSGEDLFQRSHDNITGATLNVPLEKQFEEIRHVFPTANTIGIISDPSMTRSMAESAQAMAAEQGVSVQIAWAENETEIPGALRQLRDSVDVLWMLPDKTILTPRSSRFIIFELIKSGIPVVGLSSAYVKAGALMALDCDYADNGRQSGELAVRILEGQSPAELPLTAPRSFTRSFNLKIREHMRITINEEALKDSNVVEF
jgi:putative ABC transport system substrate-binding protein